MNWTKASCCQTFIVPVLIFSQALYFQLHQCNNFLPLVHTEASWFSFSNDLRMLTCNVNYHTTAIAM